MTFALTDPDRIDELPDGRYFDGTYEWDKEGSDWTPLRAPYGMPARPTQLTATVITRHEPFTPNDDDGFDDEDELGPADNAALAALRAHKPQWGSVRP